MLAQYGEEGRSATLEGLCETINEFRNQWLEAFKNIIQLQRTAAKNREAKARAGTGGGAKAAKAGARAAGAGGMPPAMGAMMGELGGALAARGTAK